MLIAIKKIYKRKYVSAFFKKITFIYIPLVKIIEGHWVGTA